MTQRSSWENATGLSRLVLTIIVTLYLGFTALPSSATTFQLGDVFVAVGNGKVQHRDAAGNLLETLDTLQGHFTTGMAFDSLGNLYVANFDAGNIRKFDNMGGLIGTFGSGYSGAPESIVFDRNGNAYVGAVAGDNNIRKFDPLGNPVGQFAAATERVGTDWIDLAADQCTIFYTSEGLNVKRFDVCNNTQLINFNTAPLPGQSAFALRILPDGGVLVADTTLIARLNSSGQVVQTYTASGESCWFALNLDPDGKSFWSADFCSSRVHKFDIQSGTELLSFSTGTGFETVFGVVVFGELSASIVSISHSFGTQGETITNFAVNGTNFQPSSTLSLSGTGITVNSYSMRTPTLILASITIAPNAPTDPQDVTVVGPLSQQSSPSGPFTVLQAPSGQIVLTPRNAVQSRSVLLTPALPSTSCVNTDENSNPIKGTTGKVQLLARVRTAKGTPAQSVSVNFQVAGANPQTFITLTDKGGRAIFPYTGINKGLDTITVSATVGGANLVSSPAYVEWGQVTIAFKMPLPNKRGLEPMPRWTVTTRVNDPTDVNHQCNGYYSLDLVDETPGSEAPVLVPLEGTVIPTSPSGSLGTFAFIDHGSGFEAYYAHLDTPTVQVQQGNVSQGQVIAAMDSTGLVEGPTGVHLHFQVLYSGTSGKNDNLRIFVEQQQIEEYCVSGKRNINNQTCTQGSYLSTNNGLPFGTIDSPLSNAVLSSVATISGWALDDGSIGTINILVDGSPAGTATYGSARPDVCNTPGSLFTWSGFLACPNVGFTGQLDTTTLTNTSHQLSVLAVDNDGVEHVIRSIPVLVSNP